MKLTNPDAWLMFAGGCFAASDKHSYQVVTEIGRYDISPISADDNVEHHLGYVVHFLNDLGKQPGGLWQSLSTPLVPLREARSLCQQHLEKAIRSVHDRSTQMGRKQPEASLV